jgi:DNA-directed RNA polymerase specialized sigma subunit
MNQQDLDSNRHFRLFATSVERAIAKYGYLQETDITEMQKAQVEKLVGLESEWRDALVKSDRGQDIYEAFVSHILDERRNILAARPFFRERQKIFTVSISPALKARNWEEIQKFHVNWTFIRFASKRNLDKKSEVYRLTKEIEKARMELVEMNLPLAISRSRIFWSRTPKSHLTFMDFVSIATEGLLAAVDKFVLPYSEVFRSVAIGRMVGNFIESYSDTMLHFYPNDRRKIYRANKYMSKRPTGDYQTSELVDVVNKGAKLRQQTSDLEIKELVAAISILPFDLKPDTGMSDSHGNDIQEIGGKIEASPDSRPDVRAEKTEASRIVFEAIKDLPLIDQKLLRLKGVDINAMAW